LRLETTMSEVRFCPSCGAARHPGDAFCRACGRNLTEDDVHGPAPEPGADPGRPPMPLPPPDAAPPPAAPASQPTAPAPVAMPMPPPAAATQPMPPVERAGYVEVPSSRPAPSAAPPTAAVVRPPAPPGEGATPGRSVVGVRRPLRPVALVGAAAVIVGAFLPWVSGTFGGGNAFDVPLSFLWSLDTSEGVKLGLALILVGGAAVVLTFLPGTGPVRRILGVVAAAAALAYTVQLFRAIDRVGGGMGDVMDALGVAVYVTLAGGVLLAASK